MLTEAKKTLALALLDIGSIKFGKFRLKLHDKNPNAPMSPIYIDLRLLRSVPDVMDLAISVYQEMIAGLSFDRFADVPTAATPITAILSYKMRIPMISPRLDKKEHGVSRMVEGMYENGQVALLVDDLITKADSKLKAISVLEKNGIKVNNVVVLVDREQGGVQELDRHGYRCHSAFRLKELLSFYLEVERITKDEFEQTVTYLEEN